METPSKEQGSSLRSCNEHSSCTSEEAVGTPELASQEEEILWQLYRPLEECFNKCYCRSCCYHCQLCFVKKGLGITYARRPRTPKKAKAHTPFTSNQSVPNRTRHSQSKKE
ncbi:tat protein [Simian immunodeficiency virus]|uniref:Protein Tat n=1 Tax=Simian immunodeficiency virus TaxID=11723 RepID=K4MJ58_SIV|nr:tat protein [Simian immunodeficiency virus]